jgi:hypothetical protein
MTDQDLKDCFAMFKSVTGATPEECYAFAEAMMEARKPKEEIGIKTVRKGKRYDKTA